MFKKKGELIKSSKELSTQQSGETLREIERQMKTMDTHDNRYMQLARQRKELLVDLSQEKTSNSVPTYPNPQMDEGAKTLFMILFVLGSNVIAIVLLLFMYLH